MTKYEDLKNEGKRSWKLKNAKVVPVIDWTMGMMKKNLTDMCKIIPGNIITNKLQLEAVPELSDNSGEPSTQNFENRKLHSLVHAS